ncbi:hypothetical protein UlMin_003230 [Ulmus minor]
MVSKLRACCEQLSRWGNCKFNSLQNEILGLKQKLSSISSTFPSANWEEFRVVERYLNVLLGKEEQFWKQRSRVASLKDADKNTTFFHRKASSRKSKNEILGMTDLNRCWQTDLRLVDTIIGDYFYSIFTFIGQDFDKIRRVTNVIPCRVSPEVNENILKAFIEADIEEALAVIHPTKALGVGGIPAIFYHIYWGIVGAEVTKACLKVLNGGDSVESIIKW